MNSSKLEETLNSLKRDLKKCKKLEHIYDVLVDNLKGDDKELAMDILINLSHVTDSMKRFEESLNKKIKDTKKDKKKEKKLKLKNNVIYDDDEKVVRDITKEKGENIVIKDNIEVTEGVGIDFTKLKGKKSLTLENITVSGDGVGFKFI